MSKKTNLLTLFVLLTIVVVFSPTGMNLNSSIRAAPPNSPYEGVGDAIDVIEFARNDSAIFSNGANGTTFSYLGGWYPPGYRGYHLQTSVSNLRRTEDPVPNGDFDQYAEPNNNWTLTASTGGLVKSIGNVSGGNPGDCLDVELKYGNVPSGAYAWIDNDFTYTSSITPDSLKLYFDIQFSSDITMAGWLVVKVAVRYQAAEVGSWTNTTDLYHPTSWDNRDFSTAAVNGTVTIRIIIEKQGGGGGNTKGHIYFDNFRYVIGTDSKPSEVGLTLDGTPVTDTTGSAGEVDVYADPSSKEQALLANCWNTDETFEFVSPSFSDISFDYEYSMYIKSENPAAASTDFSAAADASPTWNVNYTIPGSRPPGGHVGYSYGLYLRSAWTLVEVRDINDALVSTTQYDYNTTTRFFKLKEGVGSTGDKFRIISSSLNYILEIYPQKSSSGSGPWTNLSASDYYVKDDWLRILATVQPIGPSSNTADVTIFRPNGSIWNSDASPTIDSASNSITSTAWQVTQIDPDNAGSQWQVAVSFDNDTQCGMRAESFAIVIEATASKEAPSDGATVLWGQSVFVNITWTNDDSGAYITDASARIRYIDRNLQTRYENMTANGFGAYELALGTNLMIPDRAAEFYVEIFRYGYVNITGTQLTFTINLVNDLSYSMVKPTQLTGPDEYTGETTSDAGYTSQVRFYDLYEQAYVRNDTGVWNGNIRVNFTRYHWTGSWQYYSVGSFTPNASNPTIFEKADSTYSGTTQIKYEVTMRVVSASWDFEQQNFTIIIKVVSIATDLDAVRTTIQYPPTGDGWTQYNNNTDTYEARLYWNEAFNITVFYHFAENDTGISGASATLLYGVNKKTMTAIPTGYFTYSLDTNAVGIGTTDLYVNASRLSYASQTIQIRLIVEARKTELTKDYLGSIVDLPYDDDFTVIFTFNDLVSGSPVGIVDATSSVSGYPGAKYSVVNNGDGTYTATFFGDVTETTYYVTVGFSRTNYTSQSKYFEITVRPMHTTAIGLAESVSVPWGQNVTINVSYNDTDHGGIAVSGATISFVSTNGFFNSSTDVLGIDYWLVYNPDGSYTLILNTTRVGTGMQPFTLIVTLSKDHYDASDVYTSFQVRDNLTVLQRQSLDPGTTVPRGDTLTIIFTYSNLDDGGSIISGATIDCDWFEFYWSYSYNTTLQAYVLVIRTDSCDEGSHTVTISATKTHYQEFSIIENFVVREIQTVLDVNPDYIPNWPVGFNLTLRLNYYDNDHGVQVPFANVETDWNASYYMIIYYGNGTYDLILNTTCRGVGTHAVNVTIWRDNYAQRTVIVSLTLVQIPLSVEVLSESPVTTEYNSTDVVVLTVRVRDLYGRLINNSITTYHWLGGSGTLSFIGAGVYNGSFLAGADVGAYVVTIQSNNTGYQIGINFIMLNILPTDTILNPVTSSVQAVVGETFDISILFTTIYGTGIADANVTYLWAFNRTGILSFVGGNVFNGTLDSSGLPSGQYIVYVTAGGQNVIERTTTINVVLVLIPTELQAFPTIQEVYYGLDFTLLVFFNDTLNNQGIIGANVSYIWGPLTGSLQPNGTAGWYNVSLPTTVFPVGTYSITLTADFEGYQYAINSVSVIVRPQPTTLDLVLIQTYFAPQDITTNLTGIAWTVPRGEVLFLYFNFTDAASTTITGALGTYSWTYGTGLLTFENGLYVATLNLSQTSPGTYPLQITLTLQNHETGQTPYYDLIVIRVPSTIQVITDLGGQSTGIAWPLTVFYNDTYHNLPITGGNLTVTIPELSIENMYMVDIGNGFYSFPVPAAFIQTTLHIEIRALGGLQYSSVTVNVVVPVTFHQVFISSLQLGLGVAVIGIIMIVMWLAYTRVLAIPWLVRKMRGMSRAIDRGKTPSLSKGDIGRIGSRSDLVAHLAEPAYETINIPIVTARLPATIDYEERFAEDEAIWEELKNLPRLEYHQKVELFQEMKRIPATERVWFLEDLKQQMADGTRFARKVKEPALTPELEQELQKRLKQFPQLSDAEKDRITTQLRNLPPEEWDEVFSTLAVAAKPEVIKVEEEEEILSPTDFPSLTKEEREKLLEELKDLSAEERQKALSVFREKRTDETAQGKLTSGKKKAEADEGKDAE